MRIHTVIIVALVMGALFTSGSTIDAYSKRNVSTKSRTQQVADFNVTINAPDSVGAGEIFNISVEVQLKATAAAASIISIMMELDVGLALNGSEEAIRQLGDFAPGETKVENYTAVSSPESAFSLIRVYVYQDDEQQFVETIDGPLEFYAVIGVTIRLPRLTIKGPLELKGVVPRLRLNHKEKGTLSYNITSEGQAAVLNLSFSVESPKFLEILSIVPASFDRLEADASILVVVETRCIVDSASDGKLLFSVQSNNYETLEKVVKVQAFDWYNPFKYDNKVILVTWPLLILFLIILGIVMTAYYWKKRNQRIRIKEGLEEQFGTALKIPE
ncbi:MAG: hypothetical protein ACE5OZ_10965 [Candidatus Heimdallarchaeota archaeon]